MRIGSLMLAIFIGAFVITHNWPMRLISADIPSEKQSLDLENAASRTDSITIKIRRPGARGSRIAKFGARQVVQTDEISNGKYRAIAVDDG